jgi:hypothetical protein
MNHPVFQHDQTLAYIKNDAMAVTVDGRNSYELIADVFESYWRSIIVEELTINLQALQHVHGAIPIKLQREILKLVWTVRK